jgi:hypothetical protein
MATNPNLAGSGIEVVGYCSFLSASCLPAAARPKLGDEYLVVLLHNSRGTYADHHARGFLPPGPCPLVLSFLPSSSFSPSVLLSLASPSARAHATHADRKICHGVSKYYSLLSWSETTNRGQRVTIVVKPKAHAPPPPPPIPSLDSIHDSPPIGLSGSTRVRVWLVVVAVVVPQTNTPRTTTHHHAPPRTTTHHHAPPRTTTHHHAPPRTTTRASKAVRAVCPGLRCPTTSPALVGAPTTADPGKRRSGNNNNNHHHHHFAPPTPPPRRRQRA